MPAPTNVQARQWYNTSVKPVIDAQVTALMASNSLTRRQAYEVVARALLQNVRMNQRQGG
jgi:hypothetical protein